MTEDQAGIKFWLWHEYPALVDDFARPAALFSVVTGVASSPGFSWSADMQGVSLARQDGAELFALAQDFVERMVSQALALSCADGSWAALPAPTHGVPRIIRVELHPMNGDPRVKASAEFAIGADMAAVLAGGSEDERCLAIDIVARAIGQLVELVIDSEGWPALATFPLGTLPTPANAKPAAPVRFFRDLSPERREKWLALVHRFGRSKCEHDAHGGREEPRPGDNLPARTCSYCHIELMLSADVAELLDSAHSGTAVVDVRVVALEVLDGLAAATEALTAALLGCPCTCSGVAADAVKCSRCLGLSRAARRLSAVGAALASRRGGST